MNFIRYFTYNLKSILGNHIFIKMAIVLSPIFLRQKLYQSVVTYRIERPRGFMQQLDPTFVKILSEHSENFDRRFKNGDKVIHAALRITVDLLNVDDEKADNPDPLSILQSRTVNSTDFATFFRATTELLLHKNGLDKRYSCQQYIAERRQNGTNLHDRYVSPYTGKSAFKSERDIVAIIDRQTGEKRFVDPTIYEQFHIINIDVEGERDPSVFKAAAEVSER
jgi:hypothetical protein